MVPPIQPRTNSVRLQTSFANETQNVDEEDFRFANERNIVTRPHRKDGNFDIFFMISRQSTLGWDFRHGGPDSEDV